MNQKFLKNFPMKICLQSKKAHGLLIWQTTKQQNSFPKIILGNNAKSSSMKQIIMYGITYCEGVLIMKRQRKYYGNVTIPLMEVTSMGREPPQKCLNPVFISRHFSKMLTYIASFVMNVREPDQCQS